MSPVEAWEGGVVGKGFVGRVWMGLVLVLAVAEGSAVAREQGAPASPPLLAGFDIFGVAMLYPTKAGGEEWTLAQEAVADPRFDPQTPLTRNPDGSWKVRDKQVRMHVYTSTGYDAAAIATYDREVLASNGFMQAPNDWKNVEMTGYVRVNSGGKRGRELLLAGAWGRALGRTALRGLRLPRGAPLRRPGAVAEGVLARELRRHRRTCRRRVRCAAGGWASRPSCAMCPPRRGDGRPSGAVARHEGGRRLVGEGLRHGG